MFHIHKSQSTLQTPRSTADPQRLQLFAEGYELRKEPGSWALSWCSNHPMKSSAQSLWAQHNEHFMRWQRWRQKMQRQKRIYHSGNVPIQSLYIRISWKNKKSIWVISYNEALQHHEQGIKAMAVQKLSQYSCPPLLFIFLTEVNRLSLNLFLTSSTHFSWGYRALWTHT